MKTQQEELRKAIDALRGIEGWRQEVQEREQVRGCGPGELPHKACSARLEHCSAGWASIVGVPLANMALQRQPWVSTSLRRCSHGQWWRSTLPPLAG